MNADQISGLVRAVMGIFAGWALTHGIDASTWLAITGGAVALVAALWSLYTNSTKQLIATVADKPEVTKVVVTPGLAQSIPSTKVVTQ